LRPLVGGISTPAAVDPDPTRLGRWIEASAAALGLDAEPAEVRYADVERFLGSAPPALLRLSDGSMLALLASGTVLTPDFREQRIGVATVRAELCGAVEAPLTDELNGLLESVGIRQGRWARVRATMLRQRLAGNLVAHAWLLRMEPGSNFFYLCGCRRSLNDYFCLLEHTCCSMRYGWLPGGLWALGRFQGAWMERCCGVGCCCWSRSFLCGG